VDDGESPRRYATTSPSSRPHTTASPTTAAAATPALFFVSIFFVSDDRDAAALIAVGRGGGASPVHEAAEAPGVTIARRRSCGT
jgi:hypothetical protein